MDRPISQPLSCRLTLLAAALATALGAVSAQAAEPARRAATKPALAQPADANLPTEMAPPMRLTTGKSTLLKLTEPMSRISVGNPEVADVVLINPREVYLLGKKVGSTNVFLWSKSGRTTIMDIHVSFDATGLQDKLHQLMPEERAIKVSGAGESLVLTGKVADATRVQRAVFLAEQFGSKKVINLLSTTDPMQVMLEVKVAEVSKTVLDKLGAELSLTGTSGRTSFTLLTSLLTGAAGTIGVTRSGSTNALTLDAELRNGLVKILAEPTIMAISGQEGAFLAGGKVYIPVAQGGAGIGGVAAFTLEEKEFGVGLKFTPTVLEGGRINLRVTPEVSELSQIGASFTTGTGATSVLPTITTRRASTTVQLFDGQSFAIGGLIKSNVTEALKKFPGLGEVPVIGALFRSTEFQNERSELLFIITPRLVKPVEGYVALPTDRFVAPTPAEFLLGGQMEGSPQAPVVPAAPKAAPANPQSGIPAGFELK
ncbi:MAG: type II and III secretion system protein family protein [Betaproteobacteria bacterium]|nr:MAG: type II and III secretion system protein family protein [Betaproteobacteria bacterium]